MDTHNKETFAAGVTLQFVRFEPTKQTAITSLGEGKDDKMMMFFDCKNSLPVGTTFSQLDKIVFGDFTLRVRLNDFLYGDDAAVHHYEVSLT